MVTWALSMCMCLPVVLIPGYLFLLLSRIGVKYIYFVLKHTALLAAAFSLLVHYQALKNKD